MRIRLSEYQLAMIEAALFQHYTNSDGEFDAVEEEAQLYDKIVSALEKEKSGTSVSE